MVTIKIDGKEIEVADDSPVIDAANKLGVRIPTLCHHPDLEPYGVCRICTVEARQGKRVRYVTACNYPARKGVEISTNTPKVRAIRKMLLELLLAQAPKAPDVRALAKEYGVKPGRFEIVDPEQDCHLCGLCVRTCNEIVGAAAIGFAGRGVTREVRTPLTRDPELCIGCGACTFVCPTGHIQMEKLATEYFRQHEPNGRACRWARLGVVSHLNCFNNFECYHCEVDQRLEDQFGTHPAFVVQPARKKQAQTVETIVWAPDRSYHPGHVWARPVGDVVLVGLDDFARRLIGSIKALRAAKQGELLQVGGPAWEVSCGPRTARMVAPVRGTVVEVNPLIEIDPDLVLRDPYGRGWILALRPSHPEEDLGKLLREGQVRDWLQADNQRLVRKLGVDLGVTLSDGGEIAPDLPAKLSEGDWATLVGAFFLS